MNNLPYIKQIYSQEYDPRTPGLGACFTNSASRIKVLDENPMIASHLIGMGSGKEEQFHQARHNVNMKLTNNKILTHKNFYSIETAKRIGFDHVDITEPLGSLIELRTHISRNFSGQAHPKIGIITFLKPGKEAGHAINVQYDRDQNLYRIFDDNLGVIEYPSSREFHQGFEEYMKAFYPKYSDFKIYTYKRH